MKISFLEIALRKVLNHFVHGSQTYIDRLVQDCSNSIANAL